MANNGKLIDGEIMEEGINVVGESLVRSVQGDLQVARAPEIVLDEARKAAKALQDVIESKAKKVVLNGKTYLTYEDWQTVGRFYGISAGVESTKYIEYGDVKGFESRAFAVVTSTGVHISAAEAMCLNDEANWGMRAKYDWVNGKRVKAGEEPTPLFQLRSMAQTRACAKALRNVLAFVPVLAGYEPTPAEEMVERGSAEAAQAVAVRKIAEHNSKVEATVTKSTLPTEIAKIKVNLPPVNQPSRIEQVLKESIKNAEERDAYAVSGMLTKAENKQGPKAKYLLVVIEAPGKKEIKLNLFDNHTFQDRTKLWDLLGMASGRFVSFLVKQDPNPKYHPTIIRVLKIHNIEFGEDKEPRRMSKPIEPLPPMESDVIDEYSL